MKCFRRMSYLLIAVFAVFASRPAFAHLVNNKVGEFYAGMLHPVTSAEHLLPIIALALLSGQGGKKAGRFAVLLFPPVLILGILAGSRLPMAEICHFANLFIMAALGIFLMLAHRLTPPITAWFAVATGLILGWRSGGDWAASSVGFQFVPGVALTGFMVTAVITAWVPQASDRTGRLLRSMTGCGFFIAGGALLARLLMGGGAMGDRSIGMPTEESLKALVAAPELSVSFITAAFLVAMVWGAAHALTPGHGKAIVGAYLVGARGTAWHAIYLGLTVTITHTLGVFILGLAASLAANHAAPEKIYPWLEVFSGLILLILGSTMFASRIRFFKSNSADHAQDHGHHPKHANNHVHVYDRFHIRENYHYLNHSHHHHDTAEDHHHHPPDGHHHHADEDHQHVHHHSRAVSHHPQRDDRHDSLDHSHHHGQGHSHLPPGADGSPVTWRSLLALGISGGLLPCPSALVLLLTAVALHRIGFGLALVTAFSLGLAGVLTVVGLLFIKGSRLINRAPAFAAASQWLPAVSALVVCILGGGITWSAVAKMAGG